MLTQDVVAYFSVEPGNPRGAKKTIARVLGITSGAISQWDDIVPEKQAMRLDRITKGALEYRADFYQKSPS